MMDTWAFWAVAIPAVTWAGISKSGFGSGAAFASASVLALIVPPAVALGMMLPLLMLVDAVSLRPYWRRWSWGDARVLVLGAVPGVGLGIALYTVADEDLLRLLIGGVSVGFVMWQLRPKRVAARRILPRWAGFLAGMAAGFTSFVSHAGGPPVAVYLLSRGIEKTTYQATTVLVFWIVNIAKFVPYTFLGIFTLQTVWADVVLAPFALIGAWLGVKAHHMVSEKVFFGITYVMLVLTGTKLIFDALT